MTAITSYTSSDFKCIPPELTKQILSNLHRPQDFANAMRVCKQWHRIMQCKVLWQHFLQRDFRVIATLHTQNLYRRYFEGRKKITEGEVHVRTFGNQPFLSQTLRFSEKLVILSVNSGVIQIWNTVNETLEETINAHKSFINSLVRVDDLHIASASDDGTIKIWDMEKKCAKDVFSEHEGKVLSLQLLKENTLVSTDDHHTIKVWDIKTGSCIKSLTVSVKNPRVFILHEDCLAINNGKQIIIWDLTGTCEDKIIDSEQENIRDIVLVNSDLIATCSSDSSINIIDINAGKVIKTLCGHKKAVGRLLSFQSRFVISSSIDGLIKIWDIESELCIKTLKGSTWDYSTMLITDHSRLIYSCNWGIIKIYNLVTGIIERELKGSGDIANYLSFYQETLVSNAPRGQINIWRFTPVSSPIQAIPKEILEYIFSFVSYPEIRSARCVNKHWKAIIDDSESLWQRLLEKHFFTSIPLPQKTVASKKEKVLKFFMKEKAKTPPQNPFKFTLQESMRLENKMISKNPEVHSVKMDGFCGGLRMNPLGELYLSDCTPFVKTVHLIKRKVSQLPVQNDGLISAIDLSEDKQYLAVGSANKICIWDRMTKKWTQELPCIDHQSSRLLFHGPSTLISGSEKGVILVWDLSTFTIRRSLEGHTSEIKQLQMINNHLISRARDESIKIWDLENGVVLNDLNFSQNFLPFIPFGDAGIIFATTAEEVKLFDFHKNDVRILNKQHKPMRSLAKMGDKIVAGGDDKTIEIWIPNNKNFQGTLSGHTGAVTALFALSSKLLISGTENGEVKIWDVDRKTCVRDLQGCYSKITAFELSGNNLIAIADSRACSELIIWDFTK